MVAETARTESTELCKECFHIATVRQMTPKVLDPEDYCMLTFVSNDGEPLCELTSKARMDGEPCGPMTKLWEPGNLVNV